MQSFEELAEESPSVRANQSEINDFTARSIDTGEAQKIARRRITIPVVMHVVHKRQQENISKSQITSQITALNKDFRAQNPDRASVPTVWQGLVENAKIEFKLATKDPNGKATDGITRTSTNHDSFPAYKNPVKKRSEGGAPGWPADRYLNLWVCNLADGLLGYAQFPGGPARTDGVVILLQRLWHDGGGPGAIRQGPDGNSRDRPLAESAPHLGRHDRLLGLGSRHRHPERKGPQLR